MATFGRVWLGREFRGFPTSDSNFVPGPQLETLKAQAGQLEEALDRIKRRIQKLESGIEGDR